MRYKVGDRVRIKDDISECFGINTDGLMNKWQGRVMTIHAIGPTHYYMLEDEGVWAWGDTMIAGVAEQDLEAFVAERIKEAADKAIQEWEGDHTEIQLVHGQHNVHGRAYTWQNPKRVPVKIGGIIRADTAKGEQPVIVTGTVNAKLKYAKQYKKILGKYGDEGLPF